MGKKTSNKFIPLAAFEDAESQPETQTGTAASVPKGSFYKKPDIATAGSNVNLGVGLTGPVKRNQLDFGDKAPNLPLQVKEAALMTPTSGKGYFMDTPELMKLFIDRAYSLPAAGNTLYMDLEGVNLGRTGTITIIQVYIDSIKEMYFIDNSFMGDKVFRVFGAKSGKTFKDILEDQDIKKVIFACGNDISNMYHKHGIMCKGVFDVQIAKGGQRSYIYCVKADGGLSTVEAAAMAAVKAEGLAIYKTNNCRGPPDLKAFGRRPLNYKLVLYCFIDVVMLPTLWSKYTAKMTAAELKELKAKCDARVRRCFYTPIEEDEDLYL